MIRTQSARKKISNAYGPLTTADVVDALDGELAYRSVPTILTRLRGKGAVRREQADGGED